MLIEVGAVAEYSAIIILYDGHWLLKPMPICEEAPHNTDINKHFFIYYTLFD